MTKIEETSDDSFRLKNKKTSFTELESTLDIELNEKLKLIKYQKFLYMKQ